MFLGIGMGLVGGGAQTSVQSLLFAQNEPGFTFEPWDITTLYQDRSGTAPVTAAGQGVGLRLSKDQGLALGPELVTNGDFASGSAGYVEVLGGTISYASQTMLATATTGNTGVYRDVTVVADKSYKIAWRQVSGTNIRMSIYDGAGFGTLLFSNSTGDTIVGNRAAILRPSSTTLRIYAYTSTGYTAEFDNISVRELAGNHQVASTGAKRGVYGWMPKTGRRNLLTYTEQFDNAAWQKNNLTITANTSVAPDGTTTADTLTGSGSGGTFLRGPAVTSAAAVIVSFYVKSGTATTCTIGDVNIGALAVFNLSTGTVASGAGASISSSGNGWYRCAVTYTPVSSTTGFTINPGSSLAPVTTGSILIWGAQLEAGSTATAYQRVASQYDITEAGVPTCYYVQADGVDDAYVTPTITPNTDKAQVFAGIRKLSDALGIIIEHSANATVNAGSFYAATGADNGVIGSVAGYSSASRGSAGISTSQNAQIAQSAPDNAVVVITHDIAGDLSTIRRNGVNGTNATADKGAGNFLAYPAYIYGRGGTSLPFSGLDFGHAVRFGPNLDAATIARVESLIARNTPEVTL